MPAFVHRMHLHEVILESGNEPHGLIQLVLTVLVLVASNRKSRLAWFPESGQESPEFLQREAQKRVRTAVKFTVPHKGGRKRGSVAFFGFGHLLVTLFLTFFDGFGHFCLSPFASPPFAAQWKVESRKFQLGIANPNRSLSMFSRALGIAQFESPDSRLENLDDRQITHLICVRLKLLPYDFFRGVLGLFYKKKNNRMDDQSTPQRSHIAKVLGGHRLDE